jgi:hypothetical protein
MIRFNRQYFLLALLLFIIEVLIALYVHDSIIRPYVGDLLVVILMYCAVKSILNFSVLKVAIAVLLFSYVIETLQYLHFIELVGLQNNTLASTIFGVGFSWIDIIAYTLGFAVILLAENLKRYF